jgi:hypothetical protein
MPVGLAVQRGTAGMEYGVYEYEEYDQALEKCASFYC